MSSREVSVYFAAVVAHEYTQFEVTFKNTENLISEPRHTKFVFYIQDNRDICDLSLH